MEETEEASQSCCRAERSCVRGRESDAREAKRRRCVNRSEGAKAEEDDMDG